MNTELHPYIIILITTDNAMEAQRIAKVLLDHRKIACVSIVPEIHSHFWWADNLESSRENLLIAKTKSSLLPEVINLVKETHSYSTPEIIALPIVGGNQDYQDWISNSVS